MNILLQFAPMGMGDVIAAEPTISALRKKYDANIYIIGDPKKLHDHCPGVSYDVPDDLVINLSIGFPGVATIGIEEYSNLEAMPIVDQSAHIAEIKLTCRTPSLYITDGERAVGAAMLADGISWRGESKKVIGISTDYKGDFRRDWSDKNYLCLADMLRARYDCVIVDFGLGPHTQGLSDAVFRTKSVRETVAIMSHCDIFVGSNTGIAQLAQMADLPSVLIFSMVPPERTAYDGKVVYSVHSDLDCIFCMWKDMKKVVLDGKGCYRHGQPEHCMNTVTPEMVFEKVKEHFKWKLETAKAY